MGTRDLEFLLAIESGDSAKYQRILDRLNRYAYRAASGMFSSTVLRDGVAEKAMDEVGDWVKANGHLKADYPWEYAKTIIFNSVKDSSKTRELEEIDVVAVRDTADKQAICHIDDTLRKEFVKDAGDTKDDDWGLRVFQIKDTGKPKRKTKDSYLEEYKPHKWLERLEGLASYKAWWDIRDHLLKIKSERKVNMQSFDGIVEEARYRYGEYRQNLWIKYTLVTGLIDNIRNPSERRVIKAYLSGYKQVEIAKNFGISAAFISRVVNSHLREWGWDNDARDESKLILLTHCLAAFFKDFANEVIESDCEPTQYPKHIYPEHISFGYFSKRYYIEARHKEKFYNRVVNAGETKAYLGDLEKTANNIHQLLRLGDGFYTRWYPSKTPYLELDYNNYNQWLSKPAGVSKLG